ncbi:DUF6294 family protein [Streptomyces olivoreticuli]
MFDGAKWTLCSDGSASFDATVTSSDDGDAWVIFHADLLDRNQAVMASVLNVNPFGDNPHEFAQNMPDRTQRYRFLAQGTFDPGLFGQVVSMSMTYHC